METSCGESERPGADVCAVKAARLKTQVNLINKQIKSIISFHAEPWMKIVAYICEYFF